MRVLDAESSRRAGTGLAIWRQLCCEALSVPPISFPDPLGLEACPPACFGEQAALVEVQRPRPSLVPDRPRAGPPHCQGLMGLCHLDILGAGGLRHRQSHGGRFRQLGTSNPYTAIAFEGYSRFTPTACALLQWIARRGRTVMEDAEDRRSPDSILPREFLDGVGGTVPTREAPNARRAGRRRQRFPKVCDRVERARKTSLRRRRRVVRVDQHR